MPAMETAFRTQYVVLWTGGSLDNYGQYQVASPVEIKVRWEDTQEEIEDPAGGTIITSSRVVIDRVITVGSIMWKGKLDDLPSSPTNLKRVVSYIEVPDIKGRSSRRVVLLTAYSDTLPPVE